MSRAVLQAGAVTVEYDSLQGQDAVAILPFPDPGADEGVLLIGTLAELRGVIDTASKMLDDLEESE